MYFSPKQTLLFRLNMKGSNALIIFMKAPRKGAVKTRLAQDIGEDEALEVYKSLTLNTVQSVEDADKYSLRVYLDQKEFIESTANWLHLPKEIFSVQKGDDLGEKLIHAFKTELKKFSKIVIIGTDCTGLSVGLIQSAFEKLDKTDLVIGPSFDGGYYLLGLKKTYPEIFQKITWSSSRVLNQTLKTAGAKNLSYFLLDKKRDIDTLEDLKLANIRYNSGVK